MYCRCSKPRDAAASCCKFCSSLWAAGTPHAIAGDGGWRTLRFSGCGFSRISSSLKQLRVGHVFFRFGASGLQEFVEAEEFSAEGTAVGGPFGFAGIERQRGTSGGKFGIEIIEIMECE